MTRLRRRMIEDLQLRGYAQRTVEAYVHAVVQLAWFYDRSHDQHGEEEVRQYLVRLAVTRKGARSPGARPVRHPVLLRVLTP